MDFGLLATIALLGLLIFLLVRIPKRHARLFRQAGFKVVSLEGSELVRVAEVMTGLPAVEIHKGQHQGQELSVVELDSGSSDDPNLTLILYELPGEDYPIAAAFQTSARLPSLLRRVSGGFFAQLLPLSDQAKHETAKGWNLFAQSDALPDSTSQRLAAATRISEGPFILAIGLSGRYLGIWGSRFFMRHLLAAGPKVLAILSGKEAGKPPFSEDTPGPMRG